jgi:hypothetical protein
MARVRHRRTVRWLAFVLVLAMLPTVELLEQGAHAVEHAFAGEPADHDAHHEDHDPADEHGCTGLVHVCGGHHGLGVAPSLPAAVLVAYDIGLVEPLAPADLHDLAGRAPPHRPPIA